ncbi:MAG: DUF5320 domain-containing protein [Desulfobacterales bacterium]
MPDFDLTGPAGGDSVNGRSHGYSRGVSYRFGRTWSRYSVGFGYGIGRGNQHMFWETGLPCWARKKEDGSNLGPYHEPGCSWEGEVEMLKEEAESVEDDLNEIESIMDELEAETTI